MSQKVRIENPTSGGALGVTSRRNAERYVSQGRATWTGSAAIRFHETDHRHLATAENLRRYSEIEHDRISRPMTTRELRNIPFVGDVQKLLMVRGSCLGVRKF